MGEPVEGAPTGRRPGEPTGLEEDPEADGLAGSEEDDGAEFRGRWRR